MKDKSIEELVEQYNEFKHGIEHLEGGMKVTKDEILDRLREMHVTGLKTKNGYMVSSRVSTRFTDVSMRLARELGATKTEEKIDTAKLRKLQAKGVKIKGAKSVKYLVIKEA